MSSKTLLLLLLSLSLSFQLDLEDTEILTVARGDSKPQFSISPSKKFALKFSSNPTTGSDWYLLNAEEVKSTGVISLLNLSANLGGEYVADAHGHRVVGSGGSTYFVLQSNQIEGEVEMRFVYKRLWENNNVMEKLVVLKVSK